MVEIDIDELAYRFWSIHPKELDEWRHSMPEGYKGGVRAWFFACEMRRLVASHINSGDNYDRQNSS